MTDSQPDTDAATLPSFEEALAELEAIVNKLESGDISLDDAIAAYARGTELKQQCQKRLEEAQLKVEQIKLSETGARSRLKLLIVPIARYVRLSIFRC